MNNFSKIVANVGIRVGDTSSAFANVIKGYVNQRYKEIWERFNWGTINVSFGFNTGTANIITEDSFGIITETGDTLVTEDDSLSGCRDFLLPTDFWKPLYVHDATNSIDLKEYSLQDVERRYATNLKDMGNPLLYVLFEKYVSDDIQRWIRLYPIPTVGVNLIIPYQIEPADMVADTDTPILECDYEVELGATAEAWRTKRQFAKAQDFDNQYEEHIKHMIWRRCNSMNQVVQFTPTIYPKDQLY